MRVVLVEAVVAVVRLLSPRTTSGCSSRVVLAEALVTAIKPPVRPIRARVVRLSRALKVVPEHMEIHVRNPMMAAAAVAAVAAIQAARVA